MTKPIDSEFLQIAQRRCMFLAHILIQNFERIFTVSMTGLRYVDKTLLLVCFLKYFIIEDESRVLTQDLNTFYNTINSFPGMGSLKISQ